MRIFDEYDDAVLTDLVFESNASIGEMATILQASAPAVSRRIKELGLTWVRRRDGHMSRGQAALTALMRKLLPGEKIVAEEPIGERLSLDVYCPSYKLAAEYHGRQHFQYVEYFHGDKEGFRASQARDERKQEICRNLGIVLVAFRYSDKLDQDTVYARLLEAIQQGPDIVRTPRVSMRGEPHYEAWKQRNSQYRRQQYQLRAQSYRRMRGAR